MDDFISGRFLYRPTLLSQKTYKYILAHGSHRTNRPPCPDHLESHPSTRPSRALQSPLGPIKARRPTKAHRRPTKPIGPIRTTWPSGPIKDTLGPLCPSRPLGPAIGPSRTFSQGPYYNGCTMMAYSDTMIEIGL